MPWRGEVEDGAGWGGLVPTKAEREAEKAAADMTYRGRLQALLFDLWREASMSEQQCAKYHGTDLVSMRRIFDCEAARRGLKSRDAESHVDSCGCRACDTLRNQGILPVR